MIDEDKLRAAVATAVTGIVKAILEATRDIARNDEAPQPEYLTPSAAASFASVTPETIRRWVRAGKLRGYASGRYVRVKRAELEALLRDGSPATMSPEARAMRDFG